METLTGRQTKNLQNIYYSPHGYWKGVAAIQKLAAVARVSEDVARTWLKKQAVWQIYLLAPRYVPRPKFDVSEPNEAHQADLLFLPHNHVGRKTYRYALSVVDVASRYKEAEPLTSKIMVEDADASEKIYRRGPFKWLKVFQVDRGHEFMGAVSQLLAKHGVSVRCRLPDLHRDQAIVECWNRTLAERLFGHQYVVKFKFHLPEGERSTEWVKLLPAVVVALNGEVTRLTSKKPKDPIKAKSLAQKPSLPGTRPVGLKEQKLPSGVGIRYLYQLGELEGGWRRATDPVWSLEVYRLGRSVTKPDEPVLYYLLDGPEEGFVREELLVVPPDTQLPPDGVLRH